MSIRRYIPPNVKHVLRKTRNLFAAGLERLESRWYRYICPVCTRRIKEFEPLSNYYSENMIRYGSRFVVSDFETLNEKNYSCPSCSATDRDRLYALYLSHELGPLKHGTALYLLDIAPSQPLRAFLLNYSQLTYRSADLYMEGVDDVVDITDMRIYADNHFDILVCSHVLEHVVDDRKALSELLRVLKPGGWGIVMVPICLLSTEIVEDSSVTDVGERWRLFGQYDHVRLYSKQGFLERLSASGFTVKQMGIGFFGYQAFERYGISNTSVLYIARKP